MAEIKAPVVGFDFLGIGRRAENGMGSSVDRITRLADSTRLLSGLTEPILTFGDDGRGDIGDGGPLFMDTVCELLGRFTHSMSPGSTPRSRLTLELNPASPVEASQSVGMGGMAGSKPIEVSRLTKAAFFLPSAKTDWDTWTRRNFVPATHTTALTSLGVTLRSTNVCISGFVGE